MSPQVRLLKNGVEGELRLWGRWVSGMGRPPVTTHCRLRSPFPAIPPQCAAGGGGADPGHPGKRIGALGYKEWNSRKLEGAK